VVRAAEELSYRPSRVARSLRTRITKTVGLVVPTISHPFYAAVTHGAQSVLEERGYRLVLVDSGENTGEIVEAIETLLYHGVDGLLVSTAPLGGEFSGAPIARLAAQKPSVFIDEIAPGAGVGAVVLENDRGISLLVDHVAEHGHERIGYIGGPLDRTSGLERRRGYFDAMASRGLEVPDDIVREGAWSIASGFEQCRSLLELWEPPTAIVTASGELAIGALAAARQLRVQVPHQLAVVCFDGLFFAPLLEPPLTCVAYDTHAIGADGAQLLLASIDGSGSRYAETRVQVHLVQRRSCGCDYDPTADLAELLG
jgi:LacI family transcriptional regulator